MSFWSNYHGKSMGRIQHALYCYCGLDIAERCQIDMGSITLHGIEIATYHWFTKDYNVPFWISQLDEDVPQFNFYNHKNYHTYGRNQYILMPFLDLPYMLSSAMFTIQTIRQQITLQEALQIQHCRDVLLEWNEACLGYDLIKKLNSICKREAGEYIKHLAMCAIYKI